MTVRYERRPQSDRPTRTPWDCLTEPVGSRTPSFAGRTTGNDPSLHCLTTPRVQDSRRGNKRWPRGATGPAHSGGPSQSWDEPDGGWPGGAICPADEGGRGMRHWTGAPSPAPLGDGDVGSLCARVHVGSRREIHHEEQNEGSTGMRAIPPSAAPA